MQKDYFQCYWCATKFQTLEKLISVQHLDNINCRKYLFNFYVDKRMHYCIICKKIFKKNSTRNFVDEHLYTHKQQIGEDAYNQIMDFMDFSKNITNVPSPERFDLMLYKRENDDDDKMDQMSIQQSTQIFWKVDQIYHISDTHIPKDGIIFRGSQQQQVKMDKKLKYYIIFQQFFQFLRDRKNLGHGFIVVLTGDVFDNKLSSPQSVYFFKYICKIICNICPFIIIPGYHDCQPHANRLYIELSDVKNLYIMKHHQYMQIHNDKKIINLIHIPINGTGICNIKEDQIFLHKIKNSIKKEHLNIVLQHIQHQNLLKNGYQELYQKLNINYVMLGYQHQMSVILQSPISWYAGSFIQQNFNEYTDQHGILIWNVHKIEDPCQHKMINLFRFRKIMVQINGDSFEIFDEQHGPGAELQLQKYNVVDMTFDVKNAPDFQHKVNSLKKQIIQLYQFNPSEVQHKIRLDQACQLIEVDEKKEKHVTIKQFMKQQINKNTTDQEKDYIYKKFDDLLEKIGNDDFTEQNKKIVRLIELEYQNFRILHKRQYIDLTKYQKITQISGENASGKTTLISLFFFMIYGQQLDENNKNIVTFDQNMFYGMLKMSVNSDQYIIHRIKETQKSKKSFLYKICDEETSTTRCLFIGKNKYNCEIIRQDINDVLKIVFDIDSQMIFKFLNIQYGTKTTINDFMKYFFKNHIKKEYNIGKLYKQIEQTIKELQIKYEIQKNQYDQSLTDTNQCDIDKLCNKKQTYINKIQKSNEQKGQIIGLMEKYNINEIYDIKNVLQQMKIQDIEIQLQQIQQTDQRLMNRHEFQIQSAQIAMEDQQWENEKDLKDSIKKIEDEFDKELQFIQEQIDINANHKTKTQRQKQLFHQQAKNMIFIQKLEFDTDRCQKCKDNNNHINNILHQDMNKQERQNEIDILFIEQALLMLDEKKKRIQIDRNDQIELFKQNKNVDQQQQKQKIKQQMDDQLREYDSEKKILRKKFDETVDMGQIQFSYMIQNIRQKNQQRQQKIQKIDNQIKKQEQYQKNQILLKKIYETEKENFFIIPLLKKMIKIISQVEKFIIQSVKYKLEREINQSVEKYLPDKIINIDVDFYTRDDKQRLQVFIDISKKNKKNKLSFSNLSGMEKTVSQISIIKSIGKNLLDFQIKIIFLDEILSQFDNKNSQKMEILDQLSDEFDQVFLISHLYNLKSTSQNQIHMDNGNIFL